MAHHQTILALLGFINEKEYDNLMWKL